MAALKTIRIQPGSYDVLIDGRHLYCLTSRSLTAEEAGVRWSILETDGTDAGFEPQDTKREALQAISRECGLSL